MITFIFFFRWSGSYANLHSFPTRRSSDLGGGLGLVHPRSIVAHPGRARSIARLRAAEPHQPAGRDRDHRNSTKIDRKSTRLNSSHANISYAVFCLKKKKKQ